MCERRQFIAFVIYYNFDAQRKWWRIVQKTHDALIYYTTSQYYFKNGYLLREFSWTENITR